MYAQCNILDIQYNLMEGIIDHKTDGHIIEPDDMYIKHGRNKKVNKTTKRWHLCVEWKDGTTSWERLVDLEKSNYVEVAEYAATKSLLDTPSFVWWAPYVPKKRIINIAAVTKCYHKRTHKFGIEVTNSWDDCVRLDKNKDNTLWQDAVRREMKNVRIAFKILNGEESAPSPPPTYQEIRCHMIFVQLLPLPQPQLRAHGRTDKSKRSESHPTTECARACVLFLNTEPKYYYFPITLVMT
jgi:hypothetical protein